MGIMQDNLCHPYNILSTTVHSDGLFSVPRLFLLSFQCTHTLTFFHPWEIGRETCGVICSYLSLFIIINNYFIFCPEKSCFMKGLVCVCFGVLYIIRAIFGKSSSLGSKQQLIMTEFPHLHAQSTVLVSRKTRVGEYS